LKCHTLHGCQSNTNIGRRFSFANESNNHPAKLGVFMRCKNASGRNNISVP
jgi:hypothetical protein